MALYTTCEEHCCRNGEKAITPAEQEYISSVFRDYGYAEGATFDSYKDEVEW